jgi:hypothetical protein
MEIQTQNEKETRRTKEKGPIYLRLERNVMAHSIEQVYDKIKVLHTKGLMLHRERYKTAGSYDKAQVQYMLEDIRALAGDIQHGLVDPDIEFSKTTTED